nr:TetR/AcrR family transcriptional regulator [Paraburkholderia sp. Ac-20340]
MLDVAKTAFAEKGMSASLEDIARTAGVGIGTLYRHFPSREVLVNELYRDQGSRLTAAAERLALSHPPVDAIREWLLLFIESLANRQIMAGVLSCMSPDADEFCALSGESLVTALDRLLKRAVQSGDVVVAIESLDLLCAIAGIASYIPEPDWAESARRMVNIIIIGLT